jgi:deazaflavin-dependent oxidoreductase (nitroreductase family)
MDHAIGTAPPTAKPKPRGIVRWLLRVPPLLYRTGLAGRLGRRLLLLTTTGRRTGRRRTVGLNYVIDGRTVYVFSGFGRTDWYVNLLADPRVEVQIGRERWAGLARAVEDAEERRRARALLRALAPGQGPPERVRPLIRRFGFDYDAEIRRLDDPAFDPPAVAIERSPAPDSMAAGSRAR